MGLVNTTLLDGFHIEVTSVEGTINLYPQGSVMRLTISPDVAVPLAQQDAYGVVKGSSSISIIDGIPVLNMTYFNSITQDFATKAWVQAGAFATQDYVNNVVAGLGGGTGTGTSWLEDYFTLVKPNAADSSTWYLRASKSLVSVGEIMAYASDESLPSIWSAMPIASATTLGGIKIGPASGVSIDGDGFITVTGIAGEGGVSDHGALTGLADDDHAQYFNITRGDLRYSQLGHTHESSDITDLLSVIASGQFELKTDSLGTQYLYTDKPIVSAKDIVAYSSETPNVPSLWASMPVATPATIGGIIVGDTLSIAEGVLNINGSTINLSNYYTKAESDANFAAIQTQFEVRTDGYGVEYLYTSRPIVSNAEITAYGSPDAVVPSLWDSIPIASTTSLGRVQVDGTTIVIDANGVISAIGGTGGGTLLTLNGTTLYIGETGVSSVDLTPAVNSLITGKQNTIIGAASTIASSDLTANRAVISNSAGKIDISTVTSQKLLDLDGMFELVPNSGNPYIRAKYNFVGDYEIMAYGNSSGLPASIWDSMPTASGTVKGGVKIGTGLNIDTNGVLSANIPGSQTLSFSNPYLTISGSNTVNLSTLTPNLSAYATQTWVFQNYEPKITKSTGYARWNGSQWTFLNDSYISTSHTINSIANGTGFLKNNGAGVWSYDSNTYVTSAALTNHINDSIKHITATERNNWNSAFSNLHTHSNKATLDSIDQQLSTTADTEFNSVKVADIRATNYLEGPVRTVDIKNSLLHTADFSNPVWGTYDLTSEVIQVNNPNGDLGAWKFTSGSGSSRIQQTISDSTLGKWTFSVWVKVVSPATTGTIGIMLYRDATLQQTFWSVPTTDQWVRYTFTTDYTVAHTTKQIQLFLNGGHYHIWGMQWEALETASGYVETTTSARTLSGIHLYNDTNILGDLLAYNITASQEVTAFSDIRLKDNVKSSQDVLDKVNDLRVVDYTLRQDKSNKKRIGIIAQELLEVFPQFVLGSHEDYYSINYAQMVSVCIKAIQELSEEVKELKKKLNEKSD